jgi:hypothetical protein
VPTRISLLWSLAIRDEKNRIHWEDCISLFRWFQRHLESAPYFTRKGLGAPELKRQYGRQEKRKQHFFFWTGLSKAMYFPLFRAMPRRPHIIISYKDGSIVLHLINSIRFYTDKIMIAFEIEKALFEKNIYIDGTESYFEIKEYHSPQKGEYGALLLEIGQ